MRTGNQKNDEVESIGFQLVCAETLATEGEAGTCGAGVAGGTVSRNDDCY